MRRRQLRRRGREERGVGIGYRLSARDRIAWFENRLGLGRSGISDFSRQAKSVREARSRVERVAWLLTQRRRVEDMAGLDHPRVDIERVSTKAGRLFFVGATSPNKRRILRRELRSILSGCFTAEEIGYMGSVLVEASRPKLAEAAGMCEYIYAMGRYHHKILIHPDHAGNAQVITHELVHAYRHGLYGMRDWMDRDRCEKIAELETVARLPSSQIKSEGLKCGYYYFHPEVKRMLMEGRKSDAEKLVVKLALEDKRRLGAEMDRLKGKRLREAIEKVYPETNIAKVHFSPPESLDRYFLIREKDGTERMLHVRFNKPSDPDDIKRQLREMYGDDVEVWEFRDGRKVRII